MPSSSTAVTMIIFSLKDFTKSQMSRLLSRIRSFFMVFPLNWDEMFIFLPILWVGFYVGAGTAYISA